MELTHFDEKGNARMVDVSEKAITSRSATAEGRIQVSTEVFEAIRQKTVKKGDVLTVAQVAGIMGCKRTAELRLSSTPNTRSIRFMQNVWASTLTTFCLLNLTRANRGWKLPIRLSAAARLILW